MATERNVVDFKIHNLTEEQFQELKAQGKIDPNAVYCTPDTTKERLDALEENKQDIATAVNYDNITNCITEIPQDIKLELADGVLTLKAGSKVIVPNGAGVFKEVEILSDKALSRGWNDTRFVFLQPNSSLYFEQVVHCHSGNTQPSDTYQYQVWYDTANNLVKQTSDGGATWASGCSLPICKITTGSGVVSSIDQVFNGFGYIGSTVFALPGVRGLIPNGRNADGTLKNTEFITDHVSTVTNASNLTMDLWYAISANGDIANSLTDYWKYDEQKNTWVHDDVSWSANMPFARSYANGGKVENFVSKTAFHAVDYNDFEELDNSVVHNTGDETIRGIKSFSGLRLRNDISNSKNITSNTETVLLQTTLNTDGGIDGASIIRYVLANGDREVRYRAGFSRRNSSGNSWPGIRVGVDINDNEYYRLDENPAASSNGTDIATTAWVRDLFEALYPVGSLYISTGNSCPLTSIVKKSDGSNSTWTLVAAGKSLWTGNGTTGDGTVRNTPSTGANNTIAAGLPNITANFVQGNYGYQSQATINQYISGAVNYTYKEGGKGLFGGGEGGGGQATAMQATFNASRSSSIYGNSTTVQPPAYVVNVWRRTA